jgi:acyl-CoA synthetase (AMP-forming)/AMP-acid ligase II
MFGSPALVDRLARREGAKGTRLPGLKRVISAGAPVKPDVLERLVPMLDADAIVATPYGATETLPVAIADHRTLLGDVRAKTAAGAGICVGRPAGGVRVEIVRIDDGPIERWSDALRVAPGEVGEIVVASPTVTPGYLHREEATRLAKIAGPRGETMHRMGDVGYLDDEGRLWYCGRKSHRVETPEGALFTEQVEAIFDAHPEVHRSALVGIPGPDGLASPVVCVEPEPGRGGNEPALVAGLRALGARHAHTRSIERFLVHRRPFPVDVRHNAKIFREKLAVWAKEQLR